MEALSTNTLFVMLVVFVIIAGFFSSSETAMMALNRYRLRHLVRKKHKMAILVSKLLQRIDRLLGIILIGNTFANVIASAIATIIAVRLYGEFGVLLATAVLTLVILIFAEITPKTIAATYPERLAFLAALPLMILLKLLYPIVWLANAIVNCLLWMCRLKVKQLDTESLSHDELRTLVHESGGQIKRKSQDMLLMILDLEKVSVNDIMVPRTEIVGIDVNDSWGGLLKQLSTNKHPHILVYRDSIDDALGVLHLHKIINLLIDQKLNLDKLLAELDEIYFIPESTSLNKQLVNFQLRRTSIALVVDEYGDIQGLISVEDILEEIVGEFASELDIEEPEIHAEGDGCFVINGGISIRDLNRSLHWGLPVGGPKTLSGLIIEHLEMIPKDRVSLRISGYPIEIIECEGNLVKKVRMRSKVDNEKK